jgi:hypothetical protein
MNELPAPLPLSRSMCALTLVQSVITTALLTLALLA